MGRSKMQAIISKVVENAAEQSKGRADSYRVGENSSENKDSGEDEFPRRNGPDYYNPEDDY